MKHIVIVGGGFTGSLFALKVAARGGARVTLIERDRLPAQGVAYGACDPDHLLNVPVSRMELGLTPRFLDWLSEVAGMDAEGLADAFVPRALFGRYLAARLAEAVAASDGRVRLLRGEAVAMLDPPAFGVRLWDGRAIEGDIVVLALGNLPPRPLRGLGRAADDGTLFAADPWARDALDGIDPGSEVLLIGTGLTTVDIALRLARQGHTGAIHAISRHGMLPQPHLAGGTWPGFLAAAAGASPAALMRLVRAEAARAQDAGVPWQRVLDAARPDIAGVWDRWGSAERRQFLRHGRTLWDTHRHRMAPAIAARLGALRPSGQLQIRAGRITGANPEPGGLAVTLAGRSGETTLRVSRVINCTGPRTDFDTLGAPLIADLRRRRLLRADPLALGLETLECALVDTEGLASARLFALGPLTRPAWWEITAVPEIKVQIEALAAQLAAEDASVPAPMIAAFKDLGAGI